MTTAEDSRKLRDWILENAGLEAKSLPIAIRILWMMDSERWEDYQREHTPNNLEEGLELVLSYLEAAITRSAAQVAGPPAEEYLEEGVELVLSYLEAAITRSAAQVAGPPAEEYLLSPSLPAEGKCQLSPSPPAVECLLSPCPPAEGECLLVLPPQPKWEEPERPQPKWEEPERPQPKWEEPERRCIHSPKGRSRCVHSPKGRSRCVHSPKRGESDRGRTPRSCRTTASTSHLGHHTPRTTELDTSPPEHLHFSPPHKSTQRAERDLLDWDL
ncbi:UNVERIFIED_CONTAM: hypothetical protein FKN15_047296 [Acipenser sinensis]